MFRPKISCASRYRTLEVVVASTILLLVAPLLVLVVVARRFARGPHPTAIKTFLHNGGLNDLPVLFDVIRGRASLHLHGPPPTRGASALPADTSLDHMVLTIKRISQAGELEIIGQSFRHAYIAQDSGEFDYLILAIDRAVGGKTATGSA